MNCNHAIMLMNGYRNTPCPECELKKLKKFKEAIIGWRENDWPERFDRYTAELIANYAKQKEV